MQARLLALTMVLGAGCAPVDALRERFFDGPTPRDRYVQMLDWAGLTRTALATDWAAAGDRALTDPVAIATPHAEEAWLAPEQPAALGYRVTMRRGQILSVEAGLRSDSTALLFIDVLRVTGDTLAPFRHEQSADSAARTLEFEPRRDGEYVIRIQPELLRGGRVSVRIGVDASLAFPVQGRGSGDIGSRFGAPRDGGARDHHGVDIFAPRGTPVLAPTAARVSRVQETPVGGKVVWLRDERRNQSLYYAHLDSQHVSPGEWLEPGDTVGFVGNTGNASTTPPHLHFGIYSRGPVDPWPFIDRVRGRPAVLAADTSGLGGWLRTTAERVTVRNLPESGSGALAELSRHTVMRVLAASGSWFRVLLPDGTAGYVPSAATESTERPVETTVLAGQAAIHAAPDAGTDVLEDLARGDSVDVLGSFGGFLLVRSQRGSRAWLARQ